MKVYVSPDDFLDLQRLALYAERGDVPADAILARYGTILGFRRVAELRASGEPAEVVVVWPGEPWPKG